MTNRLDRSSPNEKTDLRMKTTSTKLTEAEYLDLESFASPHGQSAGEWMSHTILNASALTGGIAGA